MILKSMLESITFSLKLELHFKSKMAGMRCMKNRLEAVGREWETLKAEKSVALFSWKWEIRTLSMKKRGKIRLNI